MKIKNKTRRPLVLPFAHGELCHFLGRCICTGHGKGGAFHVPAGGALDGVPREAVRVASVQRAKECDAIEFVEQVVAPDGPAPKATAKARGGRRS
jgi:hypothetical protein